ncbi:MAG: hypothetical protein LBT82_02270, partial [Oscillospiraceae bacterium]|nr:hypothetical protein [Oscillospiraceae bacterium]
MKKLLGKRILSLFLALGTICSSSIISSAVKYKCVNSSGIVQSFPAFTGIPIASFNKIGGQKIATEFIVNEENPIILLQTDLKHLANPVYISKNVLLDNKLFAKVPESENEKVKEPCQPPQDNLLKEENQKLMERVKVLEVENEKLKVETNRKKLNDTTLKARNEKLKEQNTNLSKQLEERDQENAKLKKQVSCITEEMSYCKQQIAAVATTISKFEDDEKFQNQLSLLVKQENEFAKEIETLNNNIDIFDPQLNSKESKKRKEA